MKYEQHLEPDEVLELAHLAAARAIVEDEHRDLARKKRRIIKRALQRARDKARRVSRVSRTVSGPEGHGQP
jgi:hypothetical protein